MIINRVSMTWNRAARWGGAVYAYKSYISASNVLLANNTAAGGLGGAIFLESSSSLEASYLTMWNNKAATPNGGDAIHLRSSSTANITNSIMWSNASDPSSLQVAIEPGSSVSLTYSDVQMAASTTWPGEGNINLDPQLMCDMPFVMPQPAAGDLGVAVPPLLGCIPWFNSPVIDGGKEADPTPPVDLRWAPRPAGRNVDMGAVEFQGLVLPLFHRFVAKKNKPLTIPKSCFGLPVEQLEDRRQGRSCLAPNGHP